MDALSIGLLVLCACFAAGALTALLHLRQTRRLLAEADRRITELEKSHDSPRTPLAHRAADLAMRAVVTTARGVRDQGVGGFLASSIEEFTGWSVADRRRIDKLADADGNVHVLFCDIEGSTSLNESLGDAAWMTLLDEHDAIVRDQVRRHRGHVVKHQGDGFMLAFGAAEHAVRAACTIHDHLATADSPGLAATRIRVRMGLHCGPTIERDGDFFGRNVAYAARIAAAAAGGELLVSDDVRRHLGPEWECAGPRTLTLKGFPGDHHGWQVTPA